MDIRIGADPELFLHSGSEFISGDLMIPGTKKDPFRVNRGAVQVDGMAVEFNIDPADTENEFLLNINTVLSVLRGMIPQYSVLPAPVAHFTPECMAAQREEAKELGCDPDFNAWTEDVNPTPNGDVPFRTGAGHIHVGWTEGADINGHEHIMMCIDLVKQLDFYLGLPSVLYDEVSQRRELYGKAGAYRVKPYGVEYRVLSNFWLKDDTHIRWAYNSTRNAIEALQGGEVMADKVGDIQDVINTSSVGGAKDILKTFSGWER